MSVVAPPLIRVQRPIVAAAIGAAWGAALLAQTTNLGERWHHDQLIEGELPFWMALVVFIAVWQIHVTAMMLPSSLPMITVFEHAARRDSQPRRSMAAFLTGCAAVWSAFGLLAFTGDAGLHAGIERWPWLHDHPSFIAGTVLITAGLFQFTGLKDRCLKQCRHPAAFLLRHYRRGPTNAFRLGLRHAVFCVGCCWALMLVMFAVGVANVTWMAPFALLMFVERVMPRGDGAVVPAGLALTMLGLLVVVHP
ncbi:MAG: DUF2182 domain-containing protein [Actinomycetota bacterium]